MFREMLRIKAVFFEKILRNLAKTPCSDCSMGRGGNTGVRSGQQAQQASTRLLILRCSGPLPEQSKLLAGAQELNKQICGNCYNHENHEYDGFVFVDELGERMRANYLTSAFPKFLESHGLRRMRFHDLRHSCASLLLANGVPLKHIQEWLGHSDFTTTANIYAHLDYKPKITSAQAMETGLALPEGGDFGSRWREG